jgi:hypothetical protein
VRIGFITQLLWSRYGDVWVHLVNGIGAEAVFASPEDVQTAFQQDSLRNVPGVALQLAVAQALALDDVDVLMAPKLNPLDVPRGSGQDPWIADFPAALAAFGNVPKVLSVPASMENIETLAFETLLSLSHEAAKVKRVWERNSHRRKPQKYPEINWNKMPYQKETVGVVGQPWMITGEVLSLLNIPESLIISQDSLESAFLKQEAPKQKRLIDTDAEVLGAARFFNRKGSVDRIIMIADKTSGADVWLEKQLEQIVTKPLEVVYLQDLIPPEKVTETLLIHS